MAANLAYQLISEQNVGILSTLSQEIPGHPFGSITPYCLDKEGQPVIYISQIAQHTKNILADNKVCITITETAQQGSEQALGRISFVSLAEEVKGDDLSDIESKYFRYFPKSSGYSGTHNFSFFKLNLVKCRYIGGFGKIHWVEKNQWQFSNPFSATQEQDILDHMNKDHQTALRDYFKGFKKQQITEEIKMVGIDGCGFHCLAENKLSYFQLEEPINNCEEARKSLVSLVKKSRQI